MLEKLWGSYVSFMSLIHSQKCSICYSVACECVAKVVLWFSQVKHLECMSLHPTPTRGTVCVHMCSVAGTWSFVPITI